MRLRVLLALGIFGGAAFAAYAIFSNVPEIGDLFGDEDCKSDEPGMTCEWGTTPTGERRCICSGELLANPDGFKYATPVWVGHNISGKVDTSVPPRPRANDEITVGVR
jgi:hypothetical protein